MGLPKDWQRPAVMGIKRFPASLSAGLINPARLDGKGSEALHFQVTQWPNPTAANAKTPAASPSPA